MQISIPTPSTTGSATAGGCRFDAQPDADHTVCHCFDVKESALKLTIREHGAGTVEDLSSHTGAGEGCKACHCRLLRVLSGLPAKCSGRFDLCGQCGCLEVNCACAAA